MDAAASLRLARLVATKLVSFIRQSGRGTDGRGRKASGHWGAHPPPLPAGGVDSASTPMPSGVRGSCCSSRVCLRMHVLHELHTAAARPVTLVPPCYPQGLPQGLPQGELSYHLLACPQSPYRSIRQATLPCRRLTEGSLYINGVQNSCHVPDWMYVHGGTDAVCSRTQAAVLQEAGRCAAGPRAQLCVPAAGRCAVLLHPPASGPPDTPGCMMLVCCTGVTGGVHLCQAQRAGRVALALRRLLPCLCYSTAGLLSPGAS